MRSILVLGALLAIVASAGSGAALLIVVEQAGATVSGQLDATLAAVEQVADAPTAPLREEGGEAGALADHVVQNQLFVAEHVAAAAAGKAAAPANLAAALVNQAWADANFAVQTELAVLLTSMDYERAVALCLTHPDAAGAAACAQVVTVAWLNDVVEA